MYSVGLTWLVEEYRSTGVEEKRYRGCDIFGWPRISIREKKKEKERGRIGKKDAIVEMAGAMVDCGCIVDDTRA